MSLTVEDVEQLLVEAHNVYERKTAEERANDPWWTSRYSVEPDLWDDAGDLSWGEIEEIFDTQGSYRIHDKVISRVEFDTGGEGHGEDIFMIFSTEDQDGNVQYWRKDGYYASFDGDNWDGNFREVNKVERLVAFYE